MIPPLPEGGRVFLTGGTGLVGSHLAEALRANGFQVRALHRSTSDTRFLSRLGCELVQGPLQSGRDAFRDWMEGCDAFVHSAANIYGRESWDGVREANVEATRALLEGALQAKLLRGVHLSTIAVYGSAPPPIDEETPLSTPLGSREFYARSKREAEEVVFQLPGQSQVATTILRPSAIYGERDRLFTPRLAAQLRLPVQFLPGGGESPLPLVYAGNVADAILHLLRASRPRGVRVYNVAGDEPTSQREVLSSLAQATGLPFRPLTVPPRLALGAASLAEWLGLRIPGAGELSLRRAIQLAVTPNPYQTQRLRTELGWAPRIGREEALARTGRWLAGELQRSGGPTA